MRRVYLDYAATTPVDPRVAEAIARIHADVPGNPGSLHVEGRQARAELEAARGAVAASIGADDPGEIVFCGSGTESDNAAVLGIARAAVAAGREPHVVVSAFEHHAVLEAARALASDGFRVTIVAPGPDGIVDPEEVGRALELGTALVSVMHANNEIGTVQDVAAIAALAHAAGAYVHTDAAQSLGKLDIDLRSLGVDALSAAGHKIHAPKGTGLLYLRTGTPFVPLLRGGGQESGRRSGTQDVAGAVSLSVALALMDAGREAESARLAALRDRLEELLAAAGDVVVYAGGARRLPHISGMGFEGIDGRMLMARLDEAGYAVSTGSACASGASAGSHVLAAIGAQPASVRGSIRVSLGRWTSAEDVDAFAAEARAIVERLRGR